MWAMESSNGSRDAKPLVLRRSHDSAERAKPKHVHPSFTRPAPRINSIFYTPAAVAMLDIEDFEVVFPDGVTYTDGIVKQIQHYQSMLGGKTFFERLLVLLKIPGKYVSSLKQNCN
jgi:hypothetical protein